MPPKLRDYEKWLEMNQAKHDRAQEKEIIMKKHVESLP